MKKTLLASLVIGFTSLIGSQQALATSYDDALLASLANKHAYLEYKYEKYAPYSGKYQAKSEAFAAYTEAYNADTESFNDAYLSKTSTYKHYLYKDPLAIVHYVSKHYGTDPVSAY